MRSLLRVSRCNTSIYAHSVYSLPQYCAPHSFFRSTVCFIRTSGGDRHDEVEIFDAQKALPQQRGYTVHTLQEYLDHEESQWKSKRSVVDSISETMDNPSWMLWALALIGASVGFTILAHRLREEQLRFDPRMHKVRSIDQPGGPKIGGPFDLIDVNGKTVTSESLKGKWLLLYFGFVNCPDVCPAEMEKLSRVTVQLDRKLGRECWQPIFITVDAQRDTPSALKEYLKDFHPRILGLTGTQEQIEQVARHYRVYFAVPDQSDPDDYLIDHSIIMYLMSPEGTFVDYTTKDFNHIEVLGKVLRRVQDYKKEKSARSELEEL